MKSISVAPSSSPPIAWSMLTVRDMRARMASRLTDRTRPSSQPSLAASWASDGSFPSFCISMRSALFSLATRFLAPVSSSPPATVSTSAFRILPRTNVSKLAPSRPAS